MKGFFVVNKRKENCPALKCGARNDTGDVVEEKGEDEEGDGRWVLSPWDTTRGA